MIPKSVPLEATGIYFLYISKLKDAFVCGISIIQGPKELVYYITTLSSGDNSTAIFFIKQKIYKMLFFNGFVQMSLIFSRQMIKSYLKSKIKKVKDGKVSTSAIFVSSLKSSRGFLWFFGQLSFLTAICVDAKS